MKDISGKNKEFTSSVKKLQKGIFSNADKRCNAVISLEMMKDRDAVPYLLKALKEESDERVRTCIIRSLGTFKDPGATETLFELALGRSPDSKQTILSSLDSCISDKDLPFLADALSSGKADRRILSIQYLGKVRNPDSIRILLGCLNDKDMEIRPLASASLKSFTEEDIIPLIGEIIEKADRYFKIRLLQLINDTKSPFAVPLLMQVLKSDDVDVRSNASKALNSCIKEESAVYLIDSLKDDNYNVKCVAIKELLVLDAEIPFDALIELLEDENEHVRSSAVEALVAIADEESLSLLEKVSQADPDEWVRKLAHNNILRIRNQTTRGDNGHSDNNNKNNKESVKLDKDIKAKKSRARKISFCPYCGNSLSLSIAPLFCPFCGENLTDNR
ncbi:HEAT repeat domain-containing protein [Methanolobus sp. WCC5]|uniref:HEAT repeat domain-containing protein n=1 Tax=Methanolobus sp. WCC5 TaxID=3125785 RepID=UPI0032521E6D